MRIQIIESANWADILRIQAQSYAADILEDEAVLRSKWASAPEHNVVCVDDHNTVLGYLLNHPWHTEEPPGLHENLEAGLPIKSWHLHDLAIAPLARGQGVANLLVQHVMDQVQRLQISSVSLIAVQGSTPFWSRYGFEAQAASSSVCESYGGEAIWMKRRFL